MEKACLRAETSLNKGSAKNAPAQKLRFLSKKAQQNTIIMQIACPIAEISHNKGSAKKRACPMAEISL